jgi:hypothetical protein
VLCHGPAPLRARRRSHFLGSADSSQRIRKPKPHCRQRWLAPMARARLVRFVRAARSMSRSFWGGHDAKGNQPQCGFALCTQLTLKRLQENKPRYTLDHLVKERCAPTDPEHAESL